MFKRVVPAAVLTVSLMSGVASAQLAPGYFYPVPVPVPVPVPYPVYTTPFVPPAINPFVPYNSGPTILPWPRTAQFPVIGTLPNGIQVINPWGPNYSRSYYNNMPYYGPGYWANPFLNPYAFGYNPFDPYQNRALNQFVVQREAPRFALTANDATMSLFNGDMSTRNTTLRDDAMFSRVPGTGSITAFGALMPASGTYVNPMNGNETSPGTTGLIRK
jgi:hypothetical protein